MNDIILDDATAEKERLKRKNAEYYARNRERLNQRAKERYQEHKAEMRPQRRKHEKKYRENHVEYVRARKHKWDMENAEACAKYAASRYRACREMTERAKFICPVFKFLTFVRKESVATYSIAYKPNERVVPKMARVCPALQVMNSKACPLVSHGTTNPEKMKSECPMNAAFQIPGAAVEIANLAKILRENQK